MTDTDRVPKSAWILGVLLSFALAGIVVLAFLVFSPSASTTFLVPLLLAAVSALVFTIVWPAGAWRWGLVLSSGFWVFFLTVFVAYLSIGQWDSLSLVRAFSSLLAGLGGWACVAWLRHGRNAPRQQA